MGTRDEPLDGLRNLAKWLRENPQLDDSGSASLRTLLDVIERQMKQLEEELEELYDDQFRHG